MPTYGTDDNWSREELAVLGGVELVRMLDPR
jgi:hypothetical protein